MGKIGIITKDRNFYKQIVQILPSEFKSSILWTLTNDFSEVYVAITDGSNLEIFKEEIPIFIIADKMPDNIRESTTIRFYKKGDFSISFFLEDLKEWLNITEGLEYYSNETKKYKNENEKLLKKIHEYEEDTKMAAKLQKKVMTPKSLRNFSSAHFYQPIMPVSGDFLFIKELNDKIFIVVGDVTDHSYLAGLYATSLYSLIAGYLETTSSWGLSITNLVTFLQHASQFYQSHDDVEYILNQRTTATMIVCEIDKISQVAKFINCGHGNEPPIISYGDGLAELISFSPDDILPPIGEGIIKTPNTPIEVPFAEGNMLFFYTDGITEIFRNSDEQTIINEYSKDRLLSSIIQETKKENWTPTSVINGVCKDAESYCLSLDSLNYQSSSSGINIHGASDDVTIFALKWEDEYDK